MPDLHLLVDERAEAALVAGLLVAPEQVPIVSARLKPDDMATPENRRAFEIMLSLSQQGRHIDALTLRREGVDVSHVLDDWYGLSKPESHVDAILDAAFRRRVDEHGRHIREMAHRANSQAEVLGALQSFNTDLAHVTHDTGLMDQPRAIETYRRVLEQRADRGVGLRYGIPVMDAVLQPAHGGDFIVVAARPSVGKTALAEAIADGWATGADKPVLFASIEMSLSQLMDRAVARTAGVPAQHIIRGTLTGPEEASIRLALDERRSVNIWYMDDPFATTTALRAAAARVSLVHGGLRAVVVDYIQLLKDPGDQEVQRVTRISRNLKAIAREHDVPLLALSQLSRQVEYRKDPHPKLHDIRESGAIEQDADVVLGLYREDERLDIDVLKNRQGPSHVRMRLRFDAERVTFTDSPLDSVSGADYDEEVDQEAWEDRPWQGKSRE